MISASEKGSAEKWKSVRRNPLVRFFAANNNNNNNYVHVGGSQPRRIVQEQKRNRRNYSNVMSAIADFL